MKRFTVNKAQSSSLAYHTANRTRRANIVRTFSRGGISF